jgi:predicted dehydrogenase
MGHPGRILVCGLGSIGRRHLRLLHALDPSLELAAWRSGNGPDCPEQDLLAARFSSLSEALAWQPQAAIVASPAPFHGAQATELASNGVALLIEKPLGTGEEPLAAWLPLQSAAMKGLPVLVGYVLRHDPAFPVLQAWLAAGQIGTPVSAHGRCGSWLPDWRPGSDYRQGVSARRDLGGGVLLELSHDLDLLRTLLGSLTVTTADLSCSGLLEIDVEDRALLAMQSAAGVPVSLQLDFCTRPPARKLVVRGSEGEIRWDLIRGCLSWMDRQGVLLEEHFSHRAEERYQLQLQHFLACCRGEAEPLVSVEDGLAVLELVRQARSAHR